MKILRVLVVETNSWSLGRRILQEICSWGQNIFHSRQPVGSRSGRPLEMSTANFHDSERMFHNMIESPQLLNCFLSKDLGCKGYCQVVTATHSCEIFVVFRVTGKSGGGFYQNLRGQFKGLYMKAFLLSSSPNILYFVLREGHPSELGGSSKRRDTELSSSSASLTI